MSSGQKVHSTAARSRARARLARARVRQSQTLKLMASGKRLADIAEELALSPKTVSVYRARILEKMGMSNNAELTHYAIKHGLVE